MVHQSCRRKHHAGRWAFVAVLLATACLARAQGYPKLTRSDLRTLQASFEVLADDVRASVVSIRTYQGMRALYSQGSGVIFRSNGYIMTNFHVLEDAPIIKVVLDGGLEYDAAVMQVDARSDLAVLKIDAENLRAARLGDLKDVRVGQWAFAVGNPFGLSNFTGTPSFSVGNISSIGRNLSNQLSDDGVPDRRYYGNLIETSAAINPGNSGGPLFNIDGEVIGIVSAIETRSGVNEGVGFAIPISGRTQAIIEKLARGEEVRYGYLGVSIKDGSAEKLHKVRGRLVRGAIIDEAVREQPAARAGLRANDVVVELNGVPIENSDHLMRLIGGLLPDTDVSVRYVRASHVKTTVAHLDDRERVLVDHRRRRDIPPTMNWGGALFAEMTRDIIRRQKVDERDVGLVIVDVRPGSFAAKRGLEPDHVVMSINGERVKTLGDFRKAYELAHDAIRMKLHNDEVKVFPRG